jgi:3-vinyl bacteriochlorophyllide hydratase
VLRSSSRQVVPLYSPAERVRRDNSKWTLVQAILAPIQFVAFLISAALVIRFLLTGQDLAIATGSVVVKTGLLYAIMITGCIWEKQVYGVYLFAPAFYWEDVFSILVLLLHSAYLFALLTEAVDARSQMWLALAAYTAYAVNAAQFVLKLRRARLQSSTSDARGLQSAAGIAA